MKHLFAKTLAAGAVVCALMSAPIYADAATPEEAAELARQYGYSEDLIQQGWNEYYANPELYPPEVIDMYMEQLRESGHKIVTEVPYDPNATVPAAATQTSPAATTTTAAGSTQTTPAQPDVITLTMPEARPSHESQQRLSSRSHMRISRLISPRSLPSSRKSSSRTSLPRSTGA